MVAVGIEMMVRRQNHHTGEGQSHMVTYFPAKANIVCTNTPVYVEFTCVIGVSPRLHIKRSVHPVRHLLSGSGTTKLHSVPEWRVLHRASPRNQRQWWGCVARQCQGCSIIIFPGLICTYIITYSTREPTNSRQGLHILP